MDIIDRASELEEAAREAAIANARKQQCLPGSPDCIDCGEEIPAARRAANPHAQRCIICQNNAERRR